MMAAAFYLSRREKSRLMRRDEKQMLILQAKSKK